MSKLRVGCKRVIIIKQVIHINIKLPIYRVLHFIYHSVSIPTVTVSSHYKTDNKNFVQEQKFELLKFNIRAKLNFLFSSLGTNV